MRINAIDFAKPAVVVLGAGATRGASFVQELRGPLPPLDSDFFTQAQRLSKSKPSSLIQELIRNTVGIFGTNFELTMEGFLTHIEHLSHVFEDYRFQGRPPGNPFPSIRDQFLQVLAAVLDESVGRDPKCKYHEVLVNTLTHSDTIISFNYDWLIDNTLRNHCHDKWNPKIGYGVDAYIQGQKGKGTQYWACEDPSSKKKVYPEETINLLKLHGSINWFPVPSDRRRLRLRIRWWHQHGKLKFEIAPPEWNKPIRSGIYQHIWRRARKSLREAKAIVFIGYSLPQTDLPTQALFMVDSGDTTGISNLELLVIANPDAEARARIRRVLSRRIDADTRVITFDYFEEFASFLEWSS
jgi:hypothetical protein